jgi:enoyl-CoA hydratase
MEFSTIQVTREGSIAVIRLNRPARMNAVIEQMYDELQEALASAKADDTVRAVVLTGCPVTRPDGTRKEAFCAGADLKAHGTGTRTEWDKRVYILAAHETTRLLHEFPKPVIAAVNGAARGAGVEMALCCDFVLMAETATMAFTETGLGTFVGGGVTRHLVQQVGMTTAKWLVYTGDVIDGPRAVELGIALQSLPLEDLHRTAMALASRLAARAPVSLQFAKEHLQAAPDRDLKTALLAETEAILACMKTEDWAEGISSFSEKRNPEFKGR